jgi:hypothetical protein
MRGFVGIEARVESPLKRWLIQIRDRDPIFFLNKLAFLSDSEKAVGFKILYDTLREERLKQMINTIRVDRKIKIIHITRRNRLKRLISQRLAKLSGVTVLIDQEYKPQTQKVTVLLKDLIADTQEIEKDERYIRQSFKRHSLFEVAYEDIVERELEATESLQRYLDVKFTKLYSPTLKLGSENLADSIENFEELKGETKGTRYAVYFDQ